MSNNIEKLKQLQKQQEQKAKQSAMQSFEGLIVVNVGVPARDHYPKLKDESENAIRDEKGRDMRSDVSDGKTYTFSEFGTGRLVKIVLSPVVEEQIELLGTYEVKGYGYDIKNANMIFIERAGGIQKF